jgi:hypothetical protein
MDPDPTPVPTPFFSDFKNAKKVSSVFSLLNIFRRKGKDPELGPDLYLRLIDPDPGGPKTCGAVFFLAIALFAY